MTDIVVVSPLTLEAILGLDFLQEQQATIDFGSKEAVSERRREGYTTERTDTTALSE